jgi:nitric oxide reductase NorD protein
MDPALSPSAAHTARQLLNELAIADPEAAEQMRCHLTNSKPEAYIYPLAGVVDEVIEALAIEVSFGRKLADGMGRMLAGGSPADLDRYRSLVNTAAARGPTLAGLFARHLVPVLTCGDNRLAQRFEETTRVMLQKGTYTLKAPLEALSALIEKKDLACAHAFLDLMAATYALKLSYNRTVYLTHTLPHAVDGFVPARRLSQIRGLTRVIRMDERLADDYLQGLASGLHLLSDEALDHFLDQVIRRHQQSPDLGARFLSLESRQAVETCRELQVAVPLSAVKSRLERYLHARTGLAVAVRPLSALSQKQAEGYTRRSAGSVRWTEHLPARRDGSDGKPRRQRRPLPAAGRAWRPAPSNSAPSTWMWIKRWMDAPLHHRWSPPMLRRPDPTWPAS